MPPCSTAWASTGRWSSGFPRAHRRRSNWPCAIRNAGAGLVLAVPRGYAPAHGRAAARPRTILWLRFMLSSDFAYWSARKISGDRLVRRMGSPAGPVVTGKCRRTRTGARHAARRPAGRPAPRRAQERPRHQADAAAARNDRPADAHRHRTRRPARHAAGGRVHGQGIAGARLIVVDDGGHLLVNRGREVTKAIGGFLEPGQTIDAKTGAVRSEALSPTWLGPGSFRRLMRGISRPLRPAAVPAPTSRIHPPVRRAAPPRRAASRSAP